MVGQRAEDRLLDRLVFGGRLDHKVRLGRLHNDAGGGDPGQGRLDLVHGDHAAGGLTIEVSLDPRDPGGDTILGEVMQQDRISGQGADMRDARSHLTCADNTDRLDLRHS